MPPRTAEYRIRESFIDNEMLRRLSLGHTLSAIARDTGYDYEVLKNRIETPVFKQRLKDFVERAEARIDEFLKTRLEDTQRTLQLCTEEMVEVILNIARNPNCKEQVRLNAACEALDRAQVLQKKVHDTGLHLALGFTFSSQILEASRAVQRELLNVTRSAELARAVDPPAIEHPMLRSGQDEAGESPEA